MGEKNKVNTCREFGLVNSAIQAVWRNRTKTISALEQNGSSIKAIDTFLKKSRKSKLRKSSTKFPFKTLYFMGLGDWQPHPIQCMLYQ
jgi:hypothetical protein